MPTMMVSVRRNVVGCAASASVAAGMASMATTQELKNIVHAVRFSLLGSFHAEANVGNEPKNITLRLVTIPTSGLRNASQSTIPRPAPPRHNLSSLDQPALPCFKARMATVHEPQSAPTI